MDNESQQSVSQPPLADGNSSKGKRTIVKKVIVKKVVKKTTSASASRNDCGDLTATNSTPSCGLGMSAQHFPIPSSYYNSLTTTGNNTYSFNNALVGMLLSPVPNFPVTSIVIANGTLVTTHENGVRMFRSSLQNDKAQSGALENGVFSASFFSSMVAKTFSDPSMRNHHQKSNPHQSNYERYQSKAERMIEKWKLRRAAEDGEPTDNNQKTTATGVTSSYLPSSVTSAVSGVTNYIPSSISEVNISSMGSYFGWGGSSSKAAAAATTHSVAVNTKGSATRTGQGPSAPSSNGPTSSSTLKDSFASKESLKSKLGESTDDDEDVENELENDFAVYELYSHRQDSNLLNSYKVVTLSPLAASSTEVAAAKKNYIAVASGDDESGHCVSILGVGGAKFLNSFQIKASSSACKDSGRTTGAHRITALKMECARLPLGPVISEPLTATEVQSRRSISHKQLQEAEFEDNYNNSARNSRQPSTQPITTPLDTNAKEATSLSYTSRVIVAAGDDGGGIILCEGSKSFTVQHSSEDDGSKSVVELALGTFAPDKSIPLIVSLSSSSQLEPSATVIGHQIVVHRILIKNVHISEAVMLSTTIISADNAPLLPSISHDQLFGFGRNVFAFAPVPSLHKILIARGRLRFWASDDRVGTTVSKSMSVYPANDNRRDEEWVNEICVLPSPPSNGTQTLSPQVKGSSTPSSSTSSILLMRTTDGNIILVKVHESAKTEAEEKQRLEDWLNDEEGPEGIPSATAPITASSAVSSTQSAMNFSVLQWVFNARIQPKGLVPLSVTFDSQTGSAIVQTNKINHIVRVSLLPYSVKGIGKLPMDSNPEAKNNTQTSGSLTHDALQKNNLPSPQEGTKRSSPESINRPRQGSPIPRNPNAEPSIITQSKASSPTVTKPSSAAIPTQSIMRSFFGYVSSGLGVSDLPSVSPPPTANGNVAPKPQQLSIAGALQGQKTTSETKEFEEDERPELRTTSTRSLVSSDSNVTSSIKLQQHRQASQRRHDNRADIVDVIVESPEDVKARRLRAEEALKIYQPPTTQAVVVFDRSDPHSKRVGKYEQSESDNLRQELSDKEVLAAQIMAQKRLKIEREISKLEDNSEPASRERIVVAERQDIVAISTEMDEGLDFIQNVSIAAEQTEVALKKGRTSDTVVMPSSKFCPLEFTFLHDQIKNMNHSTMFMIEFQNTNSYPTSLHRKKWWKKKTVEVATDEEVDHNTMNSSNQSEVNSSQNSRPTSVPPQAEQTADGGNCLSLNYLFHNEAVYKHIKHLQDIDRDSFEIEDVRAEYLEKIRAVDGKDEVVICENWRLAPATKSEGPTWVPHSTCRFQTEIGQPVNWKGINDRSAPLSFPAVYASWKWESEEKKAILKPLSTRNDADDTFTEFHPLWRVGGWRYASFFPFTDPAPAEFWSERDIKTSEDGSVVQFTARRRWLSRSRKLEGRSRLKETLTAEMNARVGEMEAALAKEKWNV